MKITLIMARGIEGTGNTRITIELCEFFRKIGNECQIIANSEKKWGRHDSQNFDILEYNFSTCKEEILEEKQDMVIVMSVPAKRNFSKEGKDFFMSLLERQKSLGSKIIYMQVDRKIHSISRNFYAEAEYIDSFFNVLYLIVTHNLTDDFCEKFLNRNLIFTTTRQHSLIACDFDSIQKGAVEEKIKKSCYFIGRNAVWKGWTVARDFHYNTLKDAGFSTVLDGIELSIGHLEQIFVQTSPERIVRYDLTIQYKDDTMEHRLESMNTRNVPARVYGPYIRNEALHRMGKAKFGLFFTYLGEEFGGPLEITLLEIVASNTIPIIRKELYDTVIFNDTDRFTNYSPEDIGVLIYDSNHPEECLSKMIKLDEDDDYYKEYVKKSYSFFKKNFDQSVILMKLWEKLQV